MAGRRANVNVGVLGHIDSGKTALARALSTTAATAAFDRPPQSRERGVTLDLGFSCFAAPPGPGPEPRLQVTLVDCPGHASLIRTIIGGAYFSVFSLFPGLCGQCCSLRSISVRRATQPQRPPPRSPTPAGPQRPPPRSPTPA